MAGGFFLKIASYQYYENFDIDIFCFFFEMSFTVNGGFVKARKCHGSLNIVFCSNRGGAYIAPSSCLEFSKKI